MASGGEVNVRLAFDTTAFRTAMAEMDAMFERAAEEKAPDEPIGKALLGAAAAAVVLAKPVSRRRLLFPWLRA